MTTTTGQALANKQEHPAAVLQRQYSGRLAALVPTHVNGEAWVRQATGTLRDADLAAAAQNDFGSFVAAVERAAVLGLRPGTEEYYLQPRKIKGRLQVQGIVGYQGLIDLMYRSGAVASVVVEAVRRADGFAYMPGRDNRPIHEIDWDAEDRGELRLVYAYAVMKGGSTSKVVVINRAKMYAEHRAKSEGYEVDVWENDRRTGKKKINQHSPWVTNEESMWLKTAARQLAKWVPTSTEYIAQQAQARHVAASVVHRADSPAPAVQSAPSVPAIEPAASQQMGELLDDDPNSQWNELDGAEAAAEGQS
jgi:recombination protein RecT